MLRRIPVCLIVLILFLSTSVAPRTAFAGQIQATPIAPVETPEPMVQDEALPIPQILQSASDFCLIQGGLLVERFPFAGTNTSSPLKLSGSRWFCEFTGGIDADPPTSRISVGLSTLYAEEPTLAALAYLAQTPVPAVEDSANLAVRYCAYLGGSSQFGPAIETGGGWASDVASPATTSIGICVFPDGSAIDDWGLTYHANGTI